jgi:hypothetical protein
MKIKKVIKKLLCLHEYKVVSTETRRIKTMPTYYVGITHIECIKCGKTHTCIQRRENKSEKPVSHNKETADSNK